MAPFLKHYLVNEADRQVLTQAQVRVEYWLRRDTSEAFEQIFLEEIRRWLREAWWFQHVVYGSRRGAAAQRAMYEATGLREVVRLTSIDGNRRFHFHA